MAISKNELMAQARGVPALSQATAIEQQRAIAQVQGALIVAQQRPRDTMAAAARMRDACNNSRLAEKAFFSYNRGGGNITGPSIHLATELARCWGNLDYGVTELRRDDAKRESEMQAYAWDLETNLKSTNTFIVPHRRDTRSGPVDLTDMRDIYESNANNAARRLRECIFRAIPKAFSEEAQELCRYTLEHGGGEPIEERREKLVTAFAEIGINARRLAKRVGKAVDKFTAFDLGELRIAYRSIKTGEAGAGELFPDDAGAKATDAVKEQMGQKSGSEARQAPTTGQGSDARTNSSSPSGDQPADGNGQSDLLGGPTDVAGAVTVLLPGEKAAKSLPYGEASEMLIELAAKRVGKAGATWIRTVISNNPWLPASSPAYAALEAEVARCEGA